MTSENSPTAVQVTQLVLYPIKSCRGIVVDEAEVGPYGLRGDRQWQIIDRDGAPLTQRTNPQMATIRATPIDDGLRIEAARHSPLTVAYPSEPSTSSTLIGAAVDVFDAGDTAADWLSAVLGGVARLVALPADVGVDVPDPLKVYGTQIGFGDLSPVLVVNAASHRWLQDRASAPFPLDRFRGNIVVDGAEPFAEETWKHLTVGEAQLANGLSWPRCAVPQVDQETGERGSEPARVLKEHRWLTDASDWDHLPVIRKVLENNAVFGMGCEIGPIGSRVRVGDAVTVTETQKPLLAPPAAI